MTMTKADACRRAAEFVLKNADGETGCCYALLLYPQRPFAYFAFREFFCADFTHHGYGWKNFSRKSQNERCLLLCLAAAMADTGDL